MKKTKAKSLSLTFLLAFLLAFVSCQKDQVAPSNQHNNTIPNAEEYSSAQYQLEDLTAIENPDLTDATINAPMGIRNAPPRCSCDSLAKGKLPPAKLGPGSLPYVLKSLHLDSVQRDSVRHFLLEHRKCICVSMHQLRKIHHDIINSANAKRKELLGLYKSGKITRQRLLQRLQLVNLRAHQAIRNHAGRKIAIKNILQCRKQFYRNVASILNQRQLQLWKKWIQNRR